MRGRDVASLCLVTFLSACGAGDPPAAAPKPTRVRVAAAERASFAVRLRVSGRIAPPIDRQASVSAPVPGRIRDVSAREGERVRQGDPLARIDSRAFDDALKSAEAALRRAEAESTFRREVARRTRELVEKGVAPRQEAESDEATAVAAEAAVVEASANVAAARRNRSFADVTAPFDGVVVRVLRHAGEQVDGTPATPVAEVAGLHPLEVSGDVPFEALARLRAGDRAEVTLPGGETVPVRVSRVAGALDAGAVVGGVRLSFVEREPALALGSPVEIALTVERLDDVVAVPKRAIRRGPEGGAEVVLAADGKARVAPVVTGPEEGGRVAVRSGLEAGAVVVVDDPLGLEEGAALEVVR